MSLLNIHPKFLLNRQSFTTIEGFLAYVKRKLPDSYDFLNNLLDNSDSITVSTSGSTGKPKEVKISKQAMLHSAEATGQFFDLQPKTKALHCLSSDFIAGKMMWVRALHLGWHLDVVSVNSTPLSHTNDSYDFVAMVPMQAEKSLEELYRVKKLIIGGAPISVALDEKLKILPTSVYQTYGMTETITHIAVKEISNKKTYYKCLPNVSIATDNRECLLIDVPRIANVQLVTNDIVRIIDDNQFEWLGRYDNVINSGGIKLFPEQIEKKLTPYLSLPFFIASVPDKSLGQKLIILVEENNKIPDDSLLITYSKAKLLDYETPKSVYYFKQFIRTENGKINRKRTLSFLLTT